jgi:hypothetical protein
MEDNNKKYDNGGITGLALKTGIAVIINFQSYYDSNNCGGS